MVFSIKHEDQEYAVRVPRGGALSPGIIDSHLAGAVLGKGIPRLEQIVAASYETGVTVAEMMPGKEMGDLSLEDIGRITDGQLDEYIDTIVAANERGIAVDPKPSNVLYDPAAGFGIVDYHSSKRAGKTPQDLGKTIGFMADPLGGGGLYGKDKGLRRDREDYAYELPFREANLDIPKRYRSIVESKLTSEDQKEALEWINRRVKSSQELVDNYSNPDWVSEQISQVAEQRNRRRLPVDPVDDFV